MLYKTGGHRGNVTETKKTCCFHWELNYGLTLGLKQSNTSMELSKIVSQILELYFSIFLIYFKIRIPPMFLCSILHRSIIFFHSFSFFSKLRFPPCSSVRYNTRHIFRTSFFLIFFLLFSLSSRFPSFFVFFTIFVLLFLYVCFLMRLLCLVCCFIIVYIILLVRCCVSIRVLLYKYHFR